MHHDNRKRASAHAQRLRALQFLALAAVLLGAIASGGASADGKAVSDDPRAQDPYWQLGRQQIAARLAATPLSHHARNVILFIGDGMGVSTVTAMRIYSGQLHGSSGEEYVLPFERFPYTALVKTYNINAQVPDSAGTASAIYTGIKTDIGVLSVTPGAPRQDCADMRAVPTILEELEDRGFATGIVTTTRLTHATPAAAYAHGPDRD